MTTTTPPIYDISRGWMITSIPPMIGRFRQDATTPLLKQPPAPGLSSPDYLQAARQAELGGNSFPSGTGAVKPGLLPRKRRRGCQARTTCRPGLPSQGGTAIPSCCLGRVPSLRPLYRRRGRDCLVYDFTAGASHDARRYPQAMRAESGGNCRLYMSKQPSPPRSRGR